MEYSIILAVDEIGGIGKDGKLPWNNKCDMAHFRILTTSQTIIMGKNTWESLPKKPLPNRVNIVLSRNEPQHSFGAATNSPVYFVQSIDAAMKTAKEFPRHVFVIGGAIIANKLLANATNLIITKIPGSYNCDRRLENWQTISASLLSVNLPDLSLGIKRSNAEESQYLQLMERVLNSVPFANRTQVKTRSLFAQSLRFQLTRQAETNEMIWPLLTTKRMAVNSIFYELIWFLRGETTLDFLHKHNVHIWDANAAGKSLGPIYGAQWRHANGRNGGMNDQIATLVDEIRTNPTSRRLLVSAWNVDEIPLMALPPCHYAFQMNVNGKRLDCLVNMRSADLALGVPFNIASYALLTHFIARLTGYCAGELILMMGNCHVYESHVAAIHEQLARPTSQFPTIEFHGKLAALNVKSSVDDLCDVELSDLVVKNYKPMPGIKMEMVV